MENDLHKECQFCNEKILFSALVCRYCGKEPITDEEIESMVSDIVISHFGGVFNIICIIVFLFIIKWWIAILAIIGGVIYFVNRSVDMEVDNTVLEIFNKHSKLIKAKEKRKKTRIITLIVISFILILTNPNKNQYEDYIKDTLIKNHTSFNKYQLSKIGQYTTRNNYVFFSVYKMNLEGDKLEVIGIAGNFFKRPE